MKALILACLLFVACEVEEDLSFQRVEGNCSENETRCDFNTRQVCVNDSWVDDIDCDSKTCAIVIIDGIPDSKCITY